MMRRLCSHGMVHLLLCLPLSAAAAQPNIVLLFADDMGWSDLGCYGSEIATPHLDRLAAQGLRFTQLYNCAKCETSRYSLLTGKYHSEGGRNPLSNSPTIAEVLRQAGYFTAMTGKWHVTGTPTGRGFDRYFGHLSGCTNYFRGDDTFYLNDKRFAVPEKDFYTTDANVDYAVRFLDDAKVSGKPFFLYVAFNAPHYPLQAWPEDIAKYRGKYMKGWDALRQERYERQLKLGLMKPEWKLSPPPADVRAWDALSDEEKRGEDLTFAVFAAMVDRLDQNIGRLMKKLDDMGVAENTLVMFLSDNGGCPFQRTKDRKVPPGGAESYWTYHEAWAGVSNTPFRWYKQNQHAGGNSTPFIARWPAVIGKGGGLNEQPGHLMDIMATCVDVAGAKYPATHEGEKTGPLRGLSLTPVFRGEQRQPHEALFWQFSNNRAVRMGDWKLVSARGGPWELYDVAADRTELNDVAAREKERAAAMAARWEAWAKEVGVGAGGGKKGKGKHAADEEQ